MAALCSAALPIANLVPHFHKMGTMRKGRPPHKVEVHFYGRHALARLLDKATAEGWANLPIGEVMGRVGTFMLDTPYVNYTLDHSADNEYCILNLQEQDCVTFVEYTLALSRLIKSGKSDEADLANEVESIRYRGGVCDGFCSRLHYLSDWFYDNGKRGLIKPYTEDLDGALTVRKKICLMSKRPEQYLQLRKHPEWVPEISKDEKAISARPICYLPKARIPAAEQYMKTGDIIAITTEAPILDCAHTGLCYRDEDGVLHFLHASLTRHKVYLDAELCKYLDRIHAFTGIMIARPQEPAG